MHLQLCIIHNGQLTHAAIDHSHLQSHGYVKMTAAPDTLTVEYVSSKTNSTLDTLVLENESEEDYYYKHIKLNLPQHINMHMRI